MRLPTSGDPDRLHRRELAAAQAVQRFHQNHNGWSDAAYSYLIGQSGTVFEVRGEQWDQFANGTDVVGSNEGSDRDFYTIMVLIGEGERPTGAAISSVKQLIAHLRNLGTGMRVLPHNRFKRKTCPGKDLEALARSLDDRPIDHGGRSANVRRPRADALANEELENDVELTKWHSQFIADAHGDTYSAAVELWQRALFGAGFDPGPVDGLIGPRTKGANRKFTESVGSSPLDRPDDETWELLIESVTRPHVDRDTLRSRLSSLSDEISVVGTHVARALDDL